MGSPYVRPTLCPHKWTLTSRDVVVECAVHNLVASVIHEYYFAGRHFLGVGSESFCELLELMLFKLATGGKPVHLPRFFFFFFFLFFLSS
jgi:hypothetical protein